jgi:hypothetical protein
VFVLQARGAAEGPRARARALARARARAGRGARARARRGARARPPAPSRAGEEKTAEELEAEAALRNVFELFATMDTTKSGSVGVAELAAALERLPVLGKRLCANLGIKETNTIAVSDSDDKEKGACHDLARRILDACDCAVPGAIKPYELERHIRGDLPPVFAYDKVEDFAERDREHQLRGAAARAEIRAEDAGGFVGLIDADEAKAIARASVTKQRVAAEMAQFAESNPELFGVGARYFTDEGLRLKRAAFLAKVNEELKKEGMLNKVGEDWTGLTAEQAAAQIESIVLGRRRGGDRRRGRAEEEAHAGAPAEAARAGHEEGAGVLGKQKAPERRRVDAYGAGVERLSWRKRAFAKRDFVV